MKKLVFGFILAVSYAGNCVAQDYPPNPLVTDVVFEADNGRIAVEAEHFYKQTMNSRNQR